MNIEDRVAQNCCAIAASIMQLGPVFGEEDIFSSCLMTQTFLEKISLIKKF
jgi:hypothetical protein